MAKRPKILPRQPEPEPEKTPPEIIGCSKDQLLRSFGFEIHKRPKVGATVWKRLEIDIIGNRITTLMNEQDALEQCKLWAKGKKEKR